MRGWNKGEGLCQVSSKERIEGDRGKWYASPRDDLSQPQQAAPWAEGRRPVQGEKQHPGVANQAH